MDAFVAKLKQKFPDTILEICIEQSKGALISGLLMQQGLRIKLDTLRKFFYACNLRGVHVQEKLELIKDAKPLTTDEVILETHSMRVEHLAKQLLAHAKTIARYDELIETVLKLHADYAIVKSLPGGAVHTQSRIIAALGTDRTRFDSAGSLQSYSGIAPVTSQSGNTKLVNSRWACPKFVRQTFQEYAGLSITKSVWAKAYYQLQLSKGKKPPAAKRALAFKWQRIIFRCWQDRQPYGESKYLARLIKTNSPLLAFIKDRA